MALLHHYLSLRWPRVIVSMYVQPCGTALDSMSDVKYCIQILCLLFCQLPFENSSWVQETAAEKVCWLCKNPLFFHFHFLFHCHFSFDFHFLFYFHFYFTFYFTFTFYFSFTFLFKLILQLVCKKSSSSSLSLLCSNPPFTFLELVSMKCCALMLKLLFWPVCVRLWILVSKWKLYQLEWLINCVCRDEFFLDWPLFCVFIQFSFWHIWATSCSECSELYSFP